MAAPGLISYRYKGRYGWIMIGAKDDAGALREARRSTSPVDYSGLERWCATRYVNLYEERCRYLENDGMTRSDAQSVVDAQLMVQP
jgi:hypothetical protein